MPDAIRVCLPIGLAPEPFTLSVTVPAAAGVFAKLEIKVTITPADKEKPLVGVTVVTTYALADPVDVPPQKYCVPPCAGVIGVVNALSAVISVFTPAPAALEKQLTRELKLELT